MAIGLSTYTFFWRLSPETGEPVSLSYIFSEAVRLGAEVVQICDYQPLEGFDDEQLKGLRAEADELGLELEVGTRGVHPAHLRRFLDIAVALRAPLVRSMLADAEGTPDLVVAEQMLREVLPEYQAAGVMLSLETYEQVRCDDLVSLVKSLDHQALGICLDPANSIAAYDLPGEVISKCAPYVNNVHVKDFSFSRREGGQGFTFTGTALGEGDLDLSAALEAVRPADRGVNLILEHWLPRQGDDVSTRALEAEWTELGMRRLRGLAASGHDSGQSKHS